MDSHEVRRRWERRSGEYSPEYYAYYGPDETSETLRALLDRYVGRDARVLELGCSSGRHLAHLHDHGYENLTGIEVNEHAFEVLADSYPALADAATLHHGAIEDLVPAFEDGAFDAVYSVETLQHLHPDARWVFDDLARITGDLLVTEQRDAHAPGVLRDVVRHLDVPGLARGLKLPGDRLWLLAVLLVARLLLSRVGDRHRLRAELQRLTARDEAETPARQQQSDERRRHQRASCAHSRRRLLGAR